MYPIARAKKACKTEQADHLPRAPVAKSGHAKLSMKRAAHKQCAELLPRVEIKNAFPLK